MFRSSHNNSQILTRFLFTRNLSTKKGTKIKEKIANNEKLPTENLAAVENGINSSFLEKTIGVTYRKWQTVLAKHPEFKSLKRKDVINSADILLKDLKFTSDDIISKPTVLYSNASTLGNRYTVLQECGFITIPIVLLVKFIAVMNKSVTMHKSFAHIPSTTNVIARLRDSFQDIEVKLLDEYPCNEDLELKVLRQQILNSYLRQRLDMTAKDIEKMWKVYKRVRHRSFISVQQMVKLLLEDLQFPKERIIKNSFLLYGDPDNVRRILNEIKTIDDQDIRSIVYRRPKILMSSCDSLLKTLEHVRKFGISENAVLKCLEVLTLGPDTVLERLRDLYEIEHFEVLGSNPRILRLVHYQNKARIRLAYLNQLKVRCASLHILSCGSEAFAKFARDGSDRTKGRDIVVYLSNVMENDEHILRSLLSRHPNWCHIPLIHVKQCYEFLLKKHFSNDDIFNNIHVLLYPIKRIEEKLQQLQYSGFLEELELPLNIYQLNNNDILTLVLYLIEFEFHFTGDGIWTEQHTQQVENFNNLLPDFPESLNKVYKYGVKPANNRENFKKQIMQS